MGVDAVPPTGPPDEAADVDGLLWYPAFDDLERPSDAPPPEEAPGFSELVDSLTEMPEQVTELARLAKTRYQEATELDLEAQPDTLGSGTDGRPNTGSWVMRLFWHPVNEVVELMGAGAVFTRSAFAPSLHCDPAALRFDPALEAHVVDGRLRVPWSRPALRVRLGVEGRSQDRTLFTLTLTSRHRPLYPKGFYPAGHRVLEALDARIAAHRGRA